MALHEFRVEFQPFRERSDEVKGAAVQHALRATDLVAVVLDVAGLVARQVDEVVALEGSNPGKGIPEHGLRGLGEYVGHEDQADGTFRTQCLETRTRIP